MRVCPAPVRQYVNSSRTPADPAPTPQQARVRQSGVRASRRVLWLLAAWGLVVLLGFGALAQYANTAGEPGAPPHEWPAGSALDHNLDRPTLLVFLHPHCPCSRASVEELSQILARAPDPVDTRIVFVRLQSVPPSWEQTDLWSAASAIPVVRVSVDDGGREACRFRVATSGTTLLYGASGGLLFHGGITGARGHAGDNAGVDGVLSGLRAGRSEPQQTPVFGCPLFDSPALSTQEVSPCPH